MEIRDNNSVYILAPLSPVLDKNEAKRVFFNLEQETRRIALDLSYVVDCTADFFEALNEFSKKKEVSLFNITSDIFVLLNSLGLDRCIKLFVSELDFEENSREIVNRRFSLV